MTSLFLVHARHAEYVNVFLFNVRRSSRNLFRTIRIEQLERILWFSELLEIVREKNGNNREARQFANTGGRV